jgi:AhpD family alkylhydroperoxidase
MSTEIASAFEAERMNIAVEAPELSRALVALERELRIDPVLRELVKLRASILNGCANCIDLHTKDARKADESEQRLYAVAAWHEAPFFNERASGAGAHRRRHPYRRHARPGGRLRPGRAPFRRPGARQPDLAGRRDQRLEPDRRRDPQDCRRLPALSRLEPRAQCVRRRRVGICLCAGG